MRLEGFSREPLGCLASLMVFAEDTKDADDSRQWTIQHKLNGIDGTKSKEVYTLNAKVGYDVIPLEINKAFNRYYEASLDVAYSYHYQIA